MQTTSSCSPAPAATRVNTRMIAFALVLVGLLGLPLYIYLDSLVSGGIKIHGDWLEVDLKAMSNFPFDQENGTVNDVPQQWRSLDGKRIQVYGQIAPSRTLGPVDQFELVYSVTQCCFVGQPQIQHFVKCRVKDSGTVPNYSGMVRVLGTLRVDVKKDDETGKVAQVYAMEVESLDQG